MCCRSWSCCQNNDMVGSLATSEKASKEEELLDEYYDMSAARTTAAAQWAAKKDSEPSEGKSEVIQEALEAVERVGHEPEPLTYRVTLSKVDGKLGVVIGYTDEPDTVARVTQIFTGSAVDAWNQNNPDKPIKAHYIILEVNGVQNAQEVCDEIRRADQLSMLIQEAHKPLEGM
mmetsp:Transcript_24754/g.57158  ORF Transcript_24754/g.57158 Transcript_24754/m.57158 type:complete len:174 (-) Transcript_24754:47-568(-)